MLEGLHFLLTYQCLYECDHCFLYCGPRMTGTFTLTRVEDALQQGIAAGIHSVYFEGGEPFLYYPLMVESLRRAKAHGLSCGIVTNGYWATSRRDAALWLAPLLEIGLDDLSVSDDAFHGDDPALSPARIALEVATEHGMPADSICIEAPVGGVPDAAEERGAPVTGGDVLFKGRAVDKLLADLPRRTWDCFTECTTENLTTPSRVHLDPFGNVFVCQGLSIGNMWEEPLEKIMRDYEPSAHPIIGPLVEGGPARLAERYGRPAGDRYVSECHLCYLVRKNLLDRFPAYLCPRQVYGEE